MKLLSIIVPFHNSEHKCNRLIETLKSYPDSQVEVVCVDDGSQDSTLRLLRDFKDAARISVKIVAQGNKGPGGARNAGMAAAEGRYVWFVDSDDDIRVTDAMGVLRENLDNDPDFIDFRIEADGEVCGSMSFQSGVYRDKKIFGEFGRICTKIFNVRVFKDSGVSYPEYCIYEDNSLVFILPFFVRDYVLSDVCAYVHGQEFGSVTRGERSDRYYDRMFTAAWGYEVFCSINKSHSTQERMWHEFIRLYLINTGKITLWPSRFWLEKARIMRMFREISSRLAMESSSGLLISLLPARRSYRYKLLFWVLYMFSGVLPSQNYYFMQKRLNAWGRPFNPPESPVARLR